MAFRKVVCGLIGIGLMVSGIGCGSNKIVNGDENFSGGTCAALFKIAAGAHSPFSKIADSASLTISAVDMDNFIRKLTITDSTVEGTVTGIPAGKNRLFTVSVFDSLDSLQYQGTARADLPRGSTVNVPITLYRVGANAVINGNVVETGSIPTDSLVAYYPFSGNANDASGKGVNGVVNGATLSTDRFGGIGSAYYFNGSSKISLGTQDLNTKQSFSICAWFQNKKTTYSVIAEQWDGVSAKAPWVLGIGGNTQATLTTNVGVCTNESSNWQMIYEPLVDTIGWHFLVLTYNVSSNKIYCALDGLIKDSLNVQTVLDINMNITIGGNNGSNSSDYFKGSIDDIRIYSRALNATEIQTTFHEGGWTGN